MSGRVWWLLAMVAAGTLGGAALYRSLNPPMYGVYSPPTTSLFSFRKAPDCFEYDAGEQKRCP